MTKFLYRLTRTINVKFHFMVEIREGKLTFEVTLQINNS